MEQPVRHEGARPSAPAPRDLSPHLLSRDYEDYLDWLENQRRGRTRGGRGIRGRILGALSGVAAVFTLAGVMLRRR